MYNHPPADFIPSKVKRVDKRNKRKGKRKEKRRQFNHTFVPILASISTHRL